jgi:hypothetical protein
MGLDRVAEVGDRRRERLADRASRRILGRRRDGRLRRNGSGGFQPPCVDDADVASFLTRRLEAAGTSG